MAKNIERPCAGSDYCHPVESAPEKKNRCTGKGECGAQNYDEQKTCDYFEPLKTCYPGNCTYLLYGNSGNCGSPKALMAKWRELKKMQEAENNDHIYPDVVHTHF